MSILNKFTIQNLKLNKKRTIVTIIGIMLSTALICAVAGMVTSTQKTLINVMIAHQGNYHVEFQDVPKDELKYIEQNANIKSYFLTKSLGYASLEGSKNEWKPYLHVMEFDKNALQNSALTLVEGRMPENSNEIVISQHIIDNARVNYKVGDTLTLDIGERLLSNGITISENKPYEPDEQENSSSDTISLSLPDESIVNTASKTYTIVGIIERPSYLLEDFSAPGYTVISYMENTDNIVNANISVLYNNAKENVENTKQIVETVKNDTGLTISTNTNVELLRYEGAVSDATLKILYGIAAVVIIIIVVSSVFVIRNSFSISISEKTKQYGMLSSVGATKKQIRKTVLLEGFYIGLIAIPLGIICGIIAIVVLLWLVNILLGDMLNGIEFVYSVPIMPILISVLVSSVTIFLSCIIPAIKATRISAIEAIRGNEDIKIKAKKMRTPKIIQKLFGIGGVIASKNLKRSKKKYRTTVISLVVSISIFISLSSFLQYGKKMTEMYYTDLSYNISVSNGTEELYKEIAKMDNINMYSYSYQTSAEIDIYKYGTEYGKKQCETYYDSMKDEYPDLDEKTYINTAGIIMFNNEYFKEFVKELGLNENDYKNIVILEDDELVYHKDDTKTMEKYYTIKSGDTIETKIDGKDRNITITKVSDKKPMGFENSYASGGWIFASEDFIEDKTDIYVSSLCIDTSKSTEVENKLIDLKEENEQYSSISITNLDLYAEQMQRMILLVSIFLYGFITVITLIGVTNIFNTITTNMILRSKEFANLKSIGMTSKEFNKMIRLESILYGLKSLIIGIPIGIIGSYFIYKSFANGIDFGYLLPWESIIISAVFVFVIVGITMKYSLNKINKQNIIETIRQDNI